MYMYNFKTVSVFFFLKNNARTWLSQCLGNNARTWLLLCFRVFLYIFDI